MRRQKNARFWTFINGGPVKLTLRPGQSLSHSRFAHTDEGWSRESYTWTHHGDRIESAWCEDGRDCDGQLTRRGTGFAQLDKLGENPAWPPDDPNMAGVLWPEWEDVETSQRDEFAELAGY